MATLGKDADLGAASAAAHGKPRPVAKAEARAHLHLERCAVPRAQLLQLLERLGGWPRCTKTGAARARREVRAVWLGD